MAGTTISASIDGTVQITATDSDISAAGRAGLGLLNVTGTALVDYDMDDFSAVTTDRFPESGAPFQPFQLWLEEDILE